MSLFTPPNGAVDGRTPKAPQACISCRKQKRKCNKALPACALCERMSRACDYSDSSPPPTSEDFNALRVKLAELEARLNGGKSAVTTPTSYTAPASSASSVLEHLGQHVAPGYPTHHESWQAIQNRFPPIAFLENSSFVFGGISIPKPRVEIPVDVLEILGDGPSIQTVIIDYISAIHRWFPIVSQHHLPRNMANPLWEAGPDLVLLLMSMKLVMSRPQDGVESSQTPAYVSTKRLIAMMEAGGMISLPVLQANILVTLFEYGQAIYPAAWMSSGWSVRYGNLLGIDTFGESGGLIGRPKTWIEQEERKRTWWGVLIIDRMISIGSQESLLKAAREPSKDGPLPIGDRSWDAAEMSTAVQRLLSDPVDEPVTAFPRLCQVHVRMGKVIEHLTRSRSVVSEPAHLEEASQIYSEISFLTQKIADEAVVPTNDYLSYTAALAAAFSTLFKLCRHYFPPPDNSHASPELIRMQSQAMEGISKVSHSVVEFADRLSALTPQVHDVYQISPLIMDSLYWASSNYAWLVREHGDKPSQMALDSIRMSLRRIGTRWRSAAEYLRILEAQEFTYAIGGSTSSSSSQTKVPPTPT